MKNNNVSNDSVDIIYDLAKEKLYRQESRWDAIDQKNYFALAVFGIIIAVVSTLDITNFSPQSITLFRVLLVVELCFIFGGILCNIFSHSLKEIRVGPNIKSLLEGTKNNPSYIRNDPWKTKVVVLSEFNDAIKYNKTVLDDKILLLKTTYCLFLPVSIILLLPFVFIKYFSGG